MDVIYRTIDEMFYRMQNNINARRNGTFSAATYDDMEDIRGEGNRAIER
jgi:hypothetical protein